MTQDKTKIDICHHRKWFLAAQKMGSFLNLKPFGLTQIKRYGFEFCNRIETVVILPL